MAILLSEQPSSTVEQTSRRLLSVMSSYGKVAVAFSGGVDSAVVAKAAALACGNQAVAITAVSPSLASGELEAARELAKQIGIRHQVIQTHEFDRAGYQRNAGDRCFYCKTELYEQIEHVLPALGVDFVCNGANLDDMGDHRPGMRAANQHAVRSPLIEAGLTKSDVRQLARDWDLEVWDKPAMPCLSSRIAYGVEVTPERVRRVDQAERYLRENFGLREFRVRLEANDVARIEVPTESIGLLVQQGRREHLVETFRSYGFVRVTIDLEGFRSGSMNRVLDVVELEPLRVES